MKRNRGKRLGWLIWVLPLWLQAQTQYAWSVVQSKTEAVQHEAVAVEYTCRFDTEAYEYIIVFNPPQETEAYRLMTRSTREQIIEGKRVNTYRFVVFPKKTGVLKLAFDASMQHTTKASIENAVIGRDNVQKIDYTAQKAVLPLVTVKVAPQDTPYAGQLKLHVDVNPKMTDAYAPVQLRVRLEGYGNIDALEPFTLDIPGVKQFTDGPEKNLRLEDNGFAGSIVQQFAFVSDHNFTIPALQLHYYDVERKQEMTLSSEVVAVTVRPAALPAAASAPLQEQRTAVRWEMAGGWLQMLLALAAGIAIGRFLLPVTAEGGEEAPLPKRLMRCSDPEKFAAYLAILDAEKYRDVIDEIEGKLKADEKVDLRRYKRLIV